MADILIIFLMPVLLVGGGLAIARFRRLSPIEDLGFRLPTARDALLWGIGFLALAVTVELLSYAVGEDPGGSWRGKYGPMDLAVRLIAIPLVYPIAEEFFFRGALLGALRKRFGDSVAILGSSAVFALAHMQYDWRGMAMVLADALFFAVCRVRTGSLYLVMAFHIAGNSFAAWQRLYA